LQTYKKENSWRKLQSEYIVRRRKETFLKKLSRTAALISLAAVLAVAAPNIIRQLSLLDLPEESSTSPDTLVKLAAPLKLTKETVKSLTRDLPFLNATKDIFFIDSPSRTLTVHTQLDTGLQTRLTATLDRLKTLTRGKPQRIAMVAMDGNTGFIKALAGFDLADKGATPCTASDYPAASIFKIVTASAAVDALGYSDRTPMYFNGNKYTLYKRQLTEKKNRYTIRIPLATAFAESINPVFGKLGKLYLGREKLNHYARGFGFNQILDTDFEVQSSAFETTENDYNLAELGCGFNRKTQISPVFATLLVSAMVNQGSSLIPRMIDKVSTAGEIIYKSHKEVYKTPIQTSTAGTMVEMMKKTVSRGTARKSFRGYSRDKVLSKLVLGGKTGSLYNTQRTVKYDWFTGFGKEKLSDKTLVVAVVVGHRKYIGTRASAHAKNILKTYFKPVPGTTM